MKLTTTYIEILTVFKRIALAHIIKEQIKTYKNMTGESKEFKTEEYLKLKKEYLVGTHYC